MPAAGQLARWPLLRDSLAALAARGHQVESLVCAAADDATRAGAARVRFVADGFLSRGLRRPARLIEAARAFRPDVVHVHSLAYPVETWWLTRALRGVPMLLQDHAGRPPRRPLSGRILRAVAARTAGVLFTVPDQAGAFMAAGALGRRTRVWEVFEGSCQFHPGDRAAARAATGMYGDPCVLSVGRLDHGKDPMTALAAVSRAAREMPGLRVYLCFAENDLEHAVRDRVAGDAELRDRVTLVGRVPHAEIELRCRAADAFLLATRREGCNLSTIEALACGTPVVTTAIPEQRQIVADAGTYFAPGDAAGAAEALVRIATGDRAEWRRRASARFAAALSYERLAERLEVVYREAVP